jgi:hypothetical protein
MYLPRQRLLTFVAELQDHSEIAMTGQSMSDGLLRRPVSRRFMIGGLAAAGGAAALAGVTCMPTAGYEAALADQLRPFAAAPDLREMVRAATLAANSHNTQPWKYRIGADRIDIVPDFSRRTPVVDPDDHHLFASLGCATENLVVAASHYGRIAEVAPPATAGGEIAVNLTGTRKEASPLFAAVTERQSSRSIYDGSDVAPGTLDELARIAGAHGVEALIVTDTRRREDILDLVLAGNRAQLEDGPFRSELKSWLRFNPNVAARGRDGLLSTASGNPSLPDWLGPLMYDLTVKPEGDNERVAVQMRSSSGLVVFSAQSDDPTGWVAAGRAYERFALAATNAGLQHAFVNQAVEVPAQRAQLQSLLGFGHRRADLIIRFGRGPKLPRSLRRSVDDVLVS